MKNNTIQAFTKWDKVYDYESDEATVTLLGKNKGKIAEFNYFRFTKADFDYYKNKCKN